MFQIDNIGVGSGRVLTRSIGQLHFPCFGTFLSRLDLQNLPFLPCGLITLVELLGFESFLLKIEVSQLRIPVLRIALFDNSEPQHRTNGKMSNARITKTSIGNGVRCFPFPYAFKRNSTVWETLVFPKGFLGLSICVPEDFPISTASNQEVF